MATYTGTKYIPNDTTLDALFAVHCLGAEEIKQPGRRVQYMLGGETLYLYCKMTRTFNTLPLWHLAPTRIIEDYDLIGVRITQHINGWIFRKDATLIRTTFSEYDQSGWMKERHHARQKSAALAHGLMLIALTLQGVDVTRRE